MSVASVAFLSNAGSEKAARTLFRASLMYLPVFMAAMALHRLPQSSHSSQNEIMADSGLHAGVQHETSMSEQTAPFKTVHDHPTRLNEDREIPISAAMPYVLAAPFPFLPLPMPPHQMGSYKAY